jgi:hypothetical protein
MEETRDYEPPRVGEWIALFCIVDACLVMTKAITDAFLEPSPGFLSWVVGFGGTIVGLVIGLLVATS